VPLVASAAFTSAIKKYGFLSDIAKNYFLGACLGPYLVSAMAVAGYYLIRRKNPHYSAKLLATTCGASLFAILALTNNLQHPPPRMDPRTAQQVAALAHNPDTPPAPGSPREVWDPALRSFFSDLNSFNEQYISEVSKLESSSFPLFTPESFRDAPTIQQSLAQLRARKEIAEKFASLDPVVGKLPAYVQKIDASEADKKKFLEGFQSTAGDGLRSLKVVKDLERDWLAASLSLYGFALSKQGSYSLHDGRLLFATRESSLEFNRKLQNSLRLRVEFLQAYRALQNQQAQALSQFGLKPSELVPPPLK
jgi:hypothetical protein